MGTGEKDFVWTEAGERDFVLFAVGRDFAGMGAVGKDFVGTEAGGKDLHSEGTLVFSWSLEGREDARRMTRLEVMEDTRSLW